jgi:murein DD-endopeptidase MepM/ murein hydrolase activator NlpD
MKTGRDRGSFADLGASPAAAAKKPRRGHGLVCATSAFAALVFLLLCLFTPSAAAPQTQEEIEKELQRIEQRIKEQQAEIARLKAEQASQEELLPALEQEIKEVEAKASLLGGEIDRLNQTVNSLKAQIEAIEQEIDSCERQIEEINAQTQAKEAQIRAMQQRLMKRLREQYMEGPVSNLQLLLSSPDLSGMLTMSEYIARQAQADAELRDGLEEEMAQLKALEEQLASQQALLEEKNAELRRQSADYFAQLVELRGEKAKLDEQHEGISRAKQEIFSIIGTLSQKSKTAQRIIDQERREQEAFERQLDALLAQKLQSGEIQKEVQNDGHMVWPFPYKGCYITSRFGDVNSVRNYSPHKGVDISIADKSREYVVIAALGGVIVDHGFHNSMGNYVVIYHGYYAPKGKTIKTTYMHLKRFESDIANNMAVQAGKVLGIMGSTGNSTVPHLHFQINEISGSNSVAVDPLGYVSNPY